MLIGEIDWSDEFAKAAINFGFVALLGGAAGFLWARAQHRRELDLAALARFYDLYGTWFAIWKAWEAWLEPGGERSESERSSLLRQATAAEGQFEALLIKIALERRLSQPEISRLGRFREGYQQLRESIEKKEELPFRVPYDADKVSAYVAFKSLSAAFAALLHSRRHTALRLSLDPRTWGRPTLRQSQRAFVEITSWRVSGDAKTTWWANPGSDSAQKALEALKASRLS